MITPSYLPEYVLTRFKIRGSAIVLSAPRTKKASEIQGLLTLQSSELEMSFPALKTLRHARGVTEPHLLSVIPKRGPHFTFNIT